MLIINNLPLKRFFSRFYIIPPAGIAGAMTTVVADIHGPAPRWRWRQLFRGHVIYAVEAGGKIPVGQDFASQTYQIFISSIVLFPYDN